MNYRHAYHAGNFADVLKHAALALAIEHLKRKEKAFAVFDSHAGRGLYDLDEREAAKTGEAKAGILRLLSLTDAPPVLAPYLACVRAGGEGRYPGSALIAASLLRRQDRLVAIEKHESEHALLAGALAGLRNARAVQGDGYERLSALLPPPERRGLVLIDPPYEAKDEFARAARALAEAWRKFPTGIFMLWYPVKSRGIADALAGEILSAGVAKLLRLELDIGRAPAMASSQAGERLSAAGLLVANPPYGFDAAMKIILGYLAKHLAQGSGAGQRLEWLAGREP